MIMYTGLTVWCCW